MAAKQLTIIMTIGPSAVTPFSFASMMDNTEIIWSQEIRFWYIWALMRGNLSSGFPTKQVSNQSPQLQRLPKNLKFHL